MVKLVSTNTARGTGVKVMVHGAAKVGKTMLAATAPAPIILSAEKGLLSLRKFNLPFIEIDTPAKLREAKGWVMASREARQFQTIFVDSGTEIGKMLLVHSILKDARQKYGDMQEEVSALIRDFRALAGPHVVFVFQSEWYKDEALGTAVYVPTLPGQALKGELAYLLDEVFYMYVAPSAEPGKSIHCLRTRPDFRTVAGDRSGALAEIEAPDLTAIFAKIANS